MEEKASSKPSMVSRLPKFGARPSGGTTAPVANGSAHVTPGSEGKSEPPGKPNGLVRASSFSLKWRKENGGPVSPQSPEQGSAAGEKVEGRGALQASPGPREIKKPATPCTKARRFGTPVTISSPKAIPKQASKRNQSPKPTPRQSPTSHPPSPQSNGPKPTQNGAGGVGSSSGSNRVPGLLRPRASSMSPRSSSRDSLSQSSDSLKTLALSSSDSMVRSQSFTHFKQLPSPTSEPITRSFSFNRAVELAKPLANTQLRTPILRPPLVLTNGRTSGLQQFGKGGFHERTSAGTPGGLGGCSTPPSALRKPLLPNCVLTKPSGLAYRLTRPAGNKPQRPLLAGRTVGEGKAEEGKGDETATNSDASPLTSPELSVDSEKVLGPDDPSEDPSCRREKDLRLPCHGEVLEDMSLSSASSLERNDTSEEFLDDFDNQGDQSHDSMPDNRQRLAASSQARLRSFLSETIDWTAGKADYGVQSSCAPLAGSPEPEVPPGSSLELSPSNSSGGTYMWDEEGMEPIGHNSHCCSTYDSEGICGDILSNLDPLESCDLEDDDLMLDVDLSEDAPLCSDADGMAHFERSDRGGRQGHWRRRQHRLTGPDHFHNDNRPVAYDGVCRMGPRALQQPAVRGDSHTVALDEITLKHMAQDCTFVKNQLLKLKTLLQLEDGAAIPESPESSEDSSALQLQELMREVQELREELRCRDRTIAQLTQQQHLHKQQQHQHQHQHQHQTAAVRCHCQQRAAVSRGERRTHYDKSTQTPWRGPAPPVLQPSSTFPSKPLTSGSLARTAHTEDRSDLRPAGVSRGPTASTLNGAVTAALPPLPDPEELSLLLSTHLKIYDSEDPQTSKSLTLGHPPGLERQPGEGVLRVSKSLSLDHPPSLETQPADGALQGSRSLSHLPLSPRVLQPPRIHKRVSIPVLMQGDARVSSDMARPSLKPGSTVNPRQLKQLPPPSRGLPCFNTGPQAMGPSLAAMLLGQPKPLGLRRDPTPIQGEKDTGLIPRTRTLVPINLSTRFPKQPNKTASQDPEFGPRKSLEEMLLPKPKIHYRLSPPEQSHCS
ncbi:serine-rich coiled-coil domain-containing protein 2 isoform X1 [Clupea harengus]|uniref:Serine-rich coiled-coil domain-containing protein 2 isoform X1 n=1 Tax=Clupea harengus TaxID=7950 RepID=A0A6P8G7M2_CLUHA|nr:serine-rich coiled-coil domain-containing protein 2 isoform X1 [Clupea harengus]XP_042565554.1 serine-rich coiled-coil domain-containing protein 2 isoform X1 [Clupea harengus]